MCRAQLEYLARSGAPENVILKARRPCRGGGRSFVIALPLFLLHFPLSSPVSSPRLRCGPLLP